MHRSRRRTTHFGERARFPRGRFRASNWTPRVESPRPLFSMGTWRLRSSGHQGTASFAEKRMQDSAWGHSHRNQVGSRRHSLPRGPSRCSKEQDVTTTWMHGESLQPTLRTFRRRSDRGSVAGASSPVNAVFVARFIAPMQRGHRPWGASIGRAMPQLGQAGTTGGVFIGMIRPAFGPWPDAAQDALPLRRQLKVGKVLVTASNPDGN